jgi:lysophospholipase L1-like esterase
MSSQSTALRALLAGLATVAWGFALWFASHHSEHPVWLGRYSSGYLAMLLGLIAVGIAAITAQFGIFYATLHRYRRWVGALVLVPLAAIGVGEMAVRVLDPWTISYYDEERRLHLLKLPDSELMYRYPAALDAEFGGVRVQTNASGWRDDPVQRAAPGERRVLLLGDSVTFGWSVADELRFSRLLEAPLAAALAAPVHVINTGVGNYNTEQEQRLLEREWQQLQPDIVTLVYVDNDLDPTPLASLDARALMDLSGRSPPQIIRYWVERSRALQLFAHARKYGLNPMSQEIDLSSAGWQASAAALQAIVKACSDHHTPLLVVFFRWQNTPASDALHAELAAILARNQVQLLDSAPWFANANPRELRNSAIDGHPNARAHAILARELTGAIAAKLTERAQQ